MKFSAGRLARLIGRGAAPKAPPPQRAPRVSKTFKSTRGGIISLEQLQNDYGREESSLGLLGVEYSINQVLLERLARVRQQCRFEYRRNPVLRRVVEGYLAGVVGKGCALKVEGAGAEAVQAAWMEFAKSVTLDGRSFAEIERQAVRSLLIEGEFLAVIHRSRKGLAINPVDPRRMPVRLNETKGAGQIAMGVEMDADGRIVAYHLTKPTKDFQHDALNSDVVNTERFAADAVIYLSAKEYPEQLRGIPMLASIMGRARNLDEYAATELERASIDSRNAGYISAPAESGETLEPDDESDGYAVVEDDAFHLREIPDGATVVPASTNHPSGVFQPFMDSQKADIAAGSGALSSAEVSGDYSKVNFSSARMARLAAQPTFEFLRGQLVKGLHDVLFNECVKFGVMQGELGPSALMRVPMWRFPAPAAIQPREQAMADHQAIADGIKSVQQIIRERGGDPDEVRREIEEDMAWYAERGLVYPGSTPVPEVTEVEVMGGAAVSA